MDHKTDYLISSTGSATILPECTLIFSGVDLLYASPAAVSMLALPSTFYTIDFAQRLYEDDRTIFKTAIAAVNSGIKQQGKLELRYLRPDKTLENFSCIFKPVESLHSNLVAMHFLDRHAALSALNEKARLTRFFETSRNITEAIKEASGKELYDTVCKNISESGLFSGVWIGLADYKKSELTRISKQGLSDEEAKDVAHVPLDLSNSQAFVFQKRSSYAFNSKVSHRLFRRLAPERRAASFAILPFYCKGRIIGMLNLYSDEFKFFKKHEMATCQAIADDIGKRLQENENERLKYESNRLIKNSEIRFRQAQTLSHTGSIEVNLEQQSCTWSKEALRIYGLPENETEQPIGKWLEQIHPDDIGCIKSIHFGKKNQHAFFRYRIIRPDGTIRYLLFSYEFKIAESGKPTKIFAGIHDITDINATASALQQSQSNLRLIVDSIPQMVFAIDSNQNIAFANDSFAAFYGQSSAALPGTPASDCITNEEDLKKFSTLCNDIIGAGIPRTIDEMPLKNFHGDVKMFYITLVPYIISGLDTCAVLSIAHDISGQKHADMERQQMIEEISNRNSDLEQFSYIVSHNLRAPVANIIGLSEELLSADHDAEIRRMLAENLSLAVQNLDQIIIDLNNILHIKSAADEKYETIYLEKLIHRVQTAILNIIVSEDVRILTDFTSAPALNGFRGYLYSIFQNLIANSIKYRQSAIPPLIQISSEQIGGHIVVVYSDNGLGIDLQRRGKDVFGLYKRFHSHKAGRGLGLFMVKTQIEAMGGKIEIESAVNQGTKFTMLFPIEAFAQH